MSQATNLETGIRTDPPASGPDAEGSWSVISLLKGILAILQSPPPVIPIVGTVDVSNFPAVQPVNVVNLPILPAVQPIAGIVSVSNFPVPPVTQPVTGAVSVTNFPAPVTSVTVSNLPATQNIAGSVAVTNFPAPPAVQPVTGTVAVSNLPATQQVAGTVAVSNLPATQQVAGTVAVSNFPAVQATRELKNTGRAQVFLSWENIAGTTAESLATFTNGSRAGVALTPATSYTVSAGKTLHIQSITFAFGGNGSAAANYRARLRQAASLLVNSPIIAGAGSGGAANSFNAVSAPYPDGLEVAAGQQIGLTHIDSASGGIFSAYLVGFEY